MDFYMALNNPNSIMCLEFSKHIPMMEAFHMQLSEQSAQPTSQFWNTIENLHSTSKAKTVGQQQPLFPLKWICFEIFHFHILQVM